jgi:hypothetical protein
MVIRGWFDELDRINLLGFPMLSSCMTCRLRAVLFNPSATRHVTFRFRVEDLSLMSVCLLAHGLVNLMGFAEWIPVYDMLCLRFGMCCGAC